MSRLLVAQRALTVPGWVKDFLWRRARAVPSLDLRFADNKSLTDAVTGQQLITFTRASTGTFTDSAGTLQTAATDVPRFDHNPTTGESLGLLVEEARTNLLQRSEEFDNAGTWGVLNATVTANTQLAPNGTTSAETLTDVNGVTSANVGCFQSTTLADSTTYAMSCYVKAGTKTTCRVGIRDKAGVNIFANFNVSTISTTVGNAVSSTIQDAGNGWYRCTTICASATGATSPRGLVYMDTGSYTANGTGTIHVWGAQLEAGALPSSYILNVNTPLGVTRSADVADLISQAIANNIRTLYLEFRSPASGTRGVVSLNDNTANERVNVLTSGTDPRLVVFDGGVEQANVNGGTVTANQRTRVAVRINANDFAISINGGAVVTDTSGTLPTVDRLMLGRTQAGEYLNSTLARIVGWDTARPDLVALSQ